MVRVRVAEADDATAIAAIYAPIVRDTWISFETEAPSAGEMAARIAKTLPRFPWLVAATGEAVVGYAYASPRGERAAYQWSADVSIYLHADARGRGVGKALYARLFDILRRQGVRNAFAGIALPNAASIGVHESLGFQPLGVYEHVGFKLGAWRSVGWWQLRLAPTDVEPAPLVAFADLRADPSLSL